MWTVTSDIWTAKGKSEQKEPEISQLMSTCRTGALVSSFYTKKPSPYTRYSRCRSSRFSYTLLRESRGWVVRSVYKNIYREHTLVIESDSIPVPSFAVKEEGTQN